MRHTFSRHSRDESQTKHEAMSEATLTPRAYWGLLQDGGILPVCSVGGYWYKVVDLVYNIESMQWIAADYELRDRLHTLMDYQLIPAPYANGWVEIIKHPVQA